MANKKGKEIDTTSLSISGMVYHGQIHRDYLAHCLRWTFVIGFMRVGSRHKTDHLLDVGCGSRVPLGVAMFGNMLIHTTGSYTGVDYGRLTWPPAVNPETTKFNMTLLEKSDFVKVKLPRESYDVITSFEMLEHVEPFHSYATLKRMRQLISGSEGRAIISTPIYDPKMGAADNHVNEMTYDALEALIKLAGWEVEQTHGTFASQKDYKKIMTKPELEIFDKLREYYSADMMANIFAPMYPRQSRNCLWVLKPGHVEKPDKKRLAELNDVKQSSSERWQLDLAKAVRDAK